VSEREHDRAGRKREKERRRPHLVGGIGARLAQYRRDAKDHQAVAERHGGDEKERDGSEGEAQEKDEPAQRAQVDGHHDEDDAGGLHQHHDEEEAELRVVVLEGGGGGRC
jgi:hypothetical protein